MGLPMGAMAEDDDELEDEVLDEIQWLYSL
jgi:hypothetical protein